MLPKWPTFGRSYVDELPNDDASHTRQCVVLNTSVLSFTRKKENMTPVFLQNFCQPTFSSGFIPNSLTLLHKKRSCYTSEKEFSEMHFESPRKSFILHFSQSAHYYTCQFPLSSTQQVEVSAAISANWRRSPTQSPTTPWLSSSGGVSIKWFWNTTTHSGFWHLGRNGKTKIIWWQLTCNPVA